MAQRFYHNSHNCILTDIDSRRIYSFEYLQADNTLYTNIGTAVCERTMSSLTFIFSSMQWFNTDEETRNKAELHKKCNSAFIFYSDM